MSRNKFHAVATIVDGHKFPSKREAKRYCELKLLARAGQIRDLKIHVPHDLVVNGEKVGRYTSDAEYLEGTGVLVIEDTKSRATMTEAARLRIKLFEAIHKIKVRIAL